MIRIRSLEELKRMEPTIRAYVQAAIELEKAGKKVAFMAEDALEYPAEFAERLASAPALRRAFESLTPGRRRAYILFFSAPKHAKTRISRIEKWLPSILIGKGMND